MIRDGDMLLIEAVAKVDPGNAAPGKSWVVFRNGDRMLLKSVTVHKTVRYSLKKGDRIRVPGRGVSPQQGLVLAVLEAHVVYQMEGHSPDPKVMPIAEAERIG